MTKSTAGIRGQTSVLLLLALMASITPGRAFASLDILPRSPETCPSSYARCSSTKLPNDFCCPSDSTCIGLDDDSSAICCPAGKDCGYISPIVCDIQQQDTKLYPESVIKTTRLSDSLPKCGDACCPFGYTCQGDNTCILNKSTSTTATAVISTSSTLTSSPSSTIATSAKEPPTTITPVASPSSEKSTTPTASAGLAASCPSFTGEAIAAGFFPGAIFGAAAALLISLCFRRRACKSETEKQEGKTGSNWSQHASSRTPFSISRPIPQDDTSYRTDFLRSPPRARCPSMGGRSTRSVLHRTGSRVRSLFSGYPRQDHRLDQGVPPVPVPPVPFTPPRQRQPSTESIKVYSPPGALSNSRNFLGPEPYPSTIARPDTTFTDLIQVVGLPRDGKGKAPDPTGENPFRDPGHPI